MSGMAITHTFPLLLVLNGGNFLLGIFFFTMKQKVADELNGKKNLRNCSFFERTLQFVSKVYGVSSGCLHAETILGQRSLL